VDIVMLGVIFEMSYNGLGNGWVGGYCDVGGGIPGFKEVESRKDLLTINSFLP